MIFKGVVAKFRNTILCCTKHERKRSLSIGSPTDVRVIDVSDSIPGLTDAQRRQIREKASSDAIRLLSLQSHPPTLPPSPTATSYPPTPSLPTDPFQPTSPPSSSCSSPASSSSSSTTAPSFREPSTALLNAASKDLPTSVPTPPRRTHKEDSPPAMRMKSMWHSERRYSSDSSGEDEVPYKTYHKKAGQSAMTLNLEWDWEDDSKDRADSPRTLSLAGEEGERSGERKKRIEGEQEEWLHGEGGRLVKG